MNKPPEKVETYYNIPLITSISVLLIGIAIVGKIPKKRTIILEFTTEWGR